MSGENKTGEEILADWGINKPKTFVDDEKEVSKEEVLLDQQIKLYRNAGIKELFIDSTFDNYICKTKEQTETMEFLKHFSLTARRQPVVHYLVGKRNTGKNHLAVATAKNFIDRKLNTKITKVSKLVRAFHDNLRVNGNEQKILNNYIRPDILIIDEVGRQRATDSELLYLEEIIDDRYEEMKPTLLIGNVSSPKEMKEFIGERSYSRYERTGSKTLVCNWEEFKR